MKKSDLGLPAMSGERILIPMDSVQARIYRALERRIVPQVRAEFERPDGNVRVRARLIRLRQASVNPELLLKPLADEGVFDTGGTGRSEEHTSELQSLMRTSYAVFCLKKKIYANSPKLSISSQPKETPEITPRRLQTHTLEHLPQQYIKHYIYIDEQFFQLHTPTPPDKNTPPHFILDLLLNIAT